MGTALVDDVHHVSNEETNPFESMMERFDRAAQLLNLEPDLYAVMRVPNRELKVYIPVRMDSGRIEVFEGYRVSTTSRAGRPRAASATRPTSPSTRCARWRRG